MRRYIPIVLTLALGVATCGCNDDLPVPSRVDGLRVLGIQADPPEVAPGDTVSLKALLVDADGRSIEAAWTACVVPERGTGPLGGAGETGEGGGAGYGLNDGGTCLEMATIDPSAVMDLGSGTETTLTIPADFLDTWSNTAQAYGLPIDNPLPPSAIEGLHSIAGVNLTVTLVVTAGDDTLVALKRINVSTATDKNENPAGMAFHLELAKGAGDAPETATPPEDGRCLTSEQGGVLSVYPGKFFLTALNVPATPVEYPVLTIGNTEADLDVITAEETYYYSLFSTVGTFNDDIMKSTGTRRVAWKLGTEDAGDTTLWVVTRDGRGGAEWCEQPVTVLEEAPAP